MDRPTQQVYVKTALFYGAVIFAGLVINRIQWIGMVKPALEGLCCLAILLILVTAKPVRVLVQNLPRPHLVVTLAFIFCMGVGQYVSLPRTTFPFMPWNMYAESRTSDQAVFFEYWGEQAGGGRVKINTTHVFRSDRLYFGLERRMAFLLSANRKNPSERAGSLPEASSRRGWLKGLVSRIRSAITCEEEMVYHEQRQQLIELLTAVGRMHNRRNPQAPLQTIEIVRGRLDFKERPLPPFVYDTVFRVDINTGEAL